MLLRARIVLPVSQPPIPDGAVEVRGADIVWVAPWREFSSEARATTVDLGDTVLLPGLVNAHCHLDYTDLAGEFLPPKSFTDWIMLMVAAKANYSYSDFAMSWLNGAKMLLRTGTTTVGDIEAVPELLPEVWDATPLRVFSFLEMTGIKSRRPPAAILQDAANLIHALPVGRCRAGLSPHAPYSTQPELLHLSAHAARKHNWRVTTHVAESVEEFEMFMRSRGAMFQWLCRNGRDTADCGSGSPIQQLERNDLLGPNFLAVHVNCLAPGDATLLAQRRASVVHCPRSHRFFDHRPFRFEELTAAGINVCLGTDSLATLTRERHQPLELNMFSEMQAFAGKYPAVPPETILRLATVNGAAALGQAGRVGELRPQAAADLIALPAAGKNADIYETVLHHTGNVAASMIAGEWALPPATHRN